jgi:hypothetical protein
MEGDKSEGDSARIRRFLGVYSTREGQVAGSVHSTVRALRILIFARCIKTEQSAL